MSRTQCNGIPLGSHLVAAEIHNDDREMAARCAYLGAALIARAQMLVAEVNRAHKSGETLAICYTEGVTGALELRLEQVRQLAGFKPRSTFTTSTCPAVDEGPPSSKQAA